MNLQKITIFLMKFKCIECIKDAKKIKKARDSKEVSQFI